MIAIVVGVISCIVSMVIVEQVKRRAILDHPTDRGLHDVPTPRGGGLGIVVVALLAWMVAAAVYGASWRAIVAWPLGAAMIAVVSIVDDVRSVSRGIRFTVHIVAAAIAVIGYGPWRTVDVFGLSAISLGVLAIPLTLIWVVAFTNIFNFMDGSNGIAGTQALVAGVAWAIVAAMYGQSTISILGAAIAGGSLGFLKHNWTPATIFMGDVGATFLGYTFAVLPLMVVATHPAEATAGALFVWPFIVDGTLTIIRRALKRENILEPHRSHLYQRLIISGRSHSAVAVLYGFLALLGFGGAALLLRNH